MFEFQGRFSRHQLMASAAVLCVAVSTPAMAQSKSYNIPAMPVKDAVSQMARAAQVQVLVPDRVAQGRKSNKLVGEYGVEEAFQVMLRDTGLTFSRSGPQTFVIKAEAAARSLGQQTVSQPAASVVAQAPAYDEIIVTAQKKEERIIDVPIAMTALSAAALDQYKIEGGSELLRAVPNVNFSKSNFSMYNFSIRGIGTKSISAASDPAVAVSFNNTPLVRNRLFESEFFDMERIEVLRGPQGTLYGRNATAGVVNLLPVLPTDEFDGRLSAEIGNYETRRIGGMLNVPLGETLGVRVSGAWTKRDGFDYNSYTQKHVNGRDLWSARAILAWEPSDRFKADVIWQRFREDDDRARTGKQLCTPDPGPTEIGGVPVLDLLQGRLSQGCLPGSIYDDAAFGAPNASGLAYLAAGQYVVRMGSRPGQPGQIIAIKHGDPYRDVVQSRNLREFATVNDPVFRAKNDIVQLNMQFEPSDALTFVSQTAYARDRYYSTQDFNRFVSAPIFNDSTGGIYAFTGLPLSQKHASPGGIFTDPQLGAHAGLVTLDMNRSRNRQWSQEFRLQSDFNGPVNFNLGMNYLNFKSQDDYFVFNNAFSFLAYNLSRSGEEYVNCFQGSVEQDCIYVDPNPIDQLDEQGHNYFLSRNIVETKSWGLFGELYWQLSDKVKLTGGLRFTHDKKIATPVPSQLLLGGNPIIGTSGGFVNAGYPADPDIVQVWKKPTGRVVLDWQPDTSFSDKTMVYASYSRGYKGGGSNPPRPALNPRLVQFQPLPETFDAEYVDALEIGIKNSFAGGRLTVNATGFYYDYDGYQVSQIVDRISLNENFDATSWGLELEAAWRPSRALRVDANLGYLKTRLKEGARSIDVMNRTQGNPDWVLVRPWIQIPSNCIAPREYVATILAHPAVSGLGFAALAALCGGSPIGSFNPEVPGVNMTRFFGITYNPLTEAPNGGRGFFDDLEGNELPNAPRMTFNLGAQYSVFMDGGAWEATLRGDYYRQSKSFSRVYNTEYDRLKAWNNFNLSLTVKRPEDGLSFQIYVKNVFDKAPITDTYTNSDDSGLSTNAFVLDPRMIGFGITKNF